MVLSGVLIIRRICHWERVISSSWYASNLRRIGIDLGCGGGWRGIRKAGYRTSDRNALGSWCDSHSFQRADASLKGLEAAEDIVVGTREAAAFKNKEAYNSREKKGVHFLLGGRIGLGPAPRPAQISVAVEVKN